MTTRTNRMLGWLTVSLLALASPALADHHEDAAKAGDAKPGKSEKAAPSPADRAKMADAHQKMADCLRSTRPVKECRTEMKKSCEGMHGAGGCSMRHHDGSDKAHGMHDAPTDAQKDKPKAK